MSATRSTVSVDQPSLGRAAVRRLDWDSDFFDGSFGVIEGVEPAAGAGRAAAVHALLEALLAEARAEHYDHLIYRVPGDDPATTHGAERAGLRLVDVGVDFVYHFDHDVRRPRPSPPGVRPWRDADLPALRDMAGAVFTHSRFGADPHFTAEQVEAFHRQWITNLCNALAREVLVFEADGAVAGFISCAVNGDEGRIPLVASSATHRRRGAGRAMVDGALDWFRMEGMRAAYVKTQAGNLPAVNLYERSGFALDRCELTFSISLARPAKNDGGLE
ncbi:MAG: GNAT family N-acetyltransferase [Dehalococcoidia bacterium]